MATFDLPLPEITVEEFPRAWTRFELVSAAKEWNAEKQALILPTLLRGKLVDYYVNLDATTKADLNLLKVALMTQDPLTAGKLFISRCQRSGENEKAVDFAYHLKKLFKQAYPDEDLASGILLQCFLTGLAPPVSQQMLLHGRLAKEVIYIHRLTQTSWSINAIFYADGLVGKVPTKILLDTGAAVSVIRYEFLSEVYRQKLTDSPGAVGANSMPLNVVGRAKIAVSLGSFSAKEEFVVYWVQTF